MFCDSALEVAQISTKGQTVLRHVLELLLVSIATS